MIERIKRPRNPAKAGETQAKRSSPGRYLPGASGNPKGMAQGYRHPKTVILQALLDEDGPAVARTALKLAKAGNVAALRLVLERLLPAQRRRTVSIDLPPIKAAGDIPRALAAVTAAVGPDEGAALGSLIGATRQAIELAEIDARLRKLEEGHGELDPSPPGARRGASCGP